VTIKDNIGLVSLANDRLEISPNYKRKAFPRIKHRPDYPAIKITRRGVNHSMQGKKVGTLLINMIKNFFLVQNRTGCRFVTVDAYQKAIAFSP